jgi:hypothetical protein
MIRPLWAAAIGMLLIAVPALSVQTPRPRGPEIENPTERESETGTEPIDRISAPLSALRQGRADPATFRLRIDWLAESEMVSAEIFGTRVGIWNDRAQVRLSAAELTSVFGELEQAEIGRMRDRYGEGSEPVRVRGKLRLTIGSEVKNVVQLAGGDQSPELAELAQRVLALARAKAPGGTKISTLDEGLDRIAVGRLAPETLRLVLLRRPDAPAGDSHSDDFLLRVEGREALAREFRSGAGYRTARVLRLSGADARSLARILRNADPQRLPANLYADSYTDLRVQVLQCTRDLQARRYANVTAETHGARQNQFDDLFDGLRRLERRVLAEGREDPRAP